MPKPILACDQNLLRASLDDELGEQQEVALARHLSECAHCQAELEQLAGNQAEWKTIGAALAREATQSSPHAPREDSEEYTADFAVDFLEPSAAEGAIGRLGDIDVLEVIGRGGMGIVLKGYQSELKRLVAVKVLSPHLAASAPARRRFAREAQAAAAIVHPSVMPILTVSSAGKLPYLVMPYVACESLQERLDRVGPLETLDILRIGMQTAAGLAAAHAQGLVHRDIKPANILLERGVERVLLTDFGLARAIDDASITRTGVIAGTPQYMSPEQAKGEPVDARSDLFSLGSGLYTMAAGRPPFRAESTFGILRRITDSTPRPLRDVNSQIPAWLAALIDKLLAKEPEDRFSTAEEVAAVLEGCLAHVQQPATTPLPEKVAELVQPVEPQLLSRGKFKVLAAGFLIAILLLGAAATAVIVNQLPALIEIGPGPKIRAPNSLPQESNAATEWNAAAKRLEELDRAADEFETRARKLWDDESLEFPPAEAGTPTQEPNP